MKYGACQFCTLQYYIPLTYLRKTNGNRTSVAQGRYNFRRQEAPLDSVNPEICMSILLRVFSLLELTQYFSRYIRLNSKKRFVALGVVSHSSKPLTHSVQVGTEGDNKALTSGVCSSKTLKNHCLSAKSHPKHFKASVLGRPSSVLPQP